MVKYRYVYDSSKSNIEKIIFAIHNSDDQGLEYLITKNKIPDYDTQKYGINLLNYAYDQDFLKGVKLLIKFGLHYHPTTILHSHLSKDNIAVYKNHLSDLKIYIPESTYQEIDKLINAIISPPIIKYNIGKCIDHSAMIANFTYTDDLNNSHKIFNFLSSIYNSHNQVVKNSFAMISLSTFAPYNNKILIYITMTKILEWHQSYTADFTDSGRGFIYVPLENLEKYQSGIFIHELEHACIEFLFKNQAKPYQKSNLEAELNYHEIVKRSIVSVMELFGGNRILKKVTEREYQTDDPVNLDYFDFIKAATYNPLILFKYKSDKNNHKFIQDMYQTFNSNADQAVYIETKNAWVDNFYKLFVKKYHLNEDQLELLDRIAVCITRPSEDIDSEMIVIPGELYAKGLNADNLRPLAELEQYFSASTSSAIFEMQKTLNIQDCTAPVDIIGKIEL